MLNNLFRWQDNNFCRSVPRNVSVAQQCSATLSCHSAGAQNFHQISALFAFLAHVSQIFAPEEALQVTQQTCSPRTILPSITPMLLIQGCFLFRPRLFATQIAKFTGQISISNWPREYQHSCLEINLPKFLDLCWGHVKLYSAEALTEPSGVETCGEGDDEEADD